MKEKGINDTLTIDRGELKKRGCTLNVNNVMLINPSKDIMLKDLHHVILNKAIITAMSFIHGSGCLIKCIGK